MLTTRRVVLAGSAASVAMLAACQPTVASGAQLTAALDHQVTEILKQSPELCTGLAVTEAQAGGRYIDRLAGASKADLVAGKQVAQDGITALNAINRDSLSAAEKVTYDVVKTSNQNTVDALQWEVGAGAQFPYVVTQLNGVYQQTPDFLDSQHPITNRDQADAYIARLRAYATTLDQETQRISEDTGAGVIPPDFAIDRALQQMNTALSQQPENTTLVRSIQRRVAEVAEISEADRTALVTQATTVVRDNVLPSLRRQMEALTAVRPRAWHDAGVWKQPNGEQMYAAGLRSFTTTTLSADEIHNMGQEVAADMTSQMDTILKAEGMTRGTVAERIQALSRRPDQLYPNTDAGRAQCLADLNAQVQAIKAMMPTVCGTLAHADLQIVRVPVDVQAGAPGGYYNGAALDGSRPGSYYINLRDMSEWPKFMLPTLTYHEGIPGHHWQISIQREAQGLPFIRSAILGFGAYAEGWGLYSEALADEMGVYSSNQLARLGYLQSAAFRASRLIVDTGMHSKRWSREQAIDSMMTTTGRARSAVTTEIERYAVWPGQACSYMVGRQAIMRARQAAETAMGARFDRKGFHDVVLTNGSTPLTVMESLVQEWAARPA